MNRKKQSGVTLIEVLVTLFVMAIGLLGLAGLQSTTIKDGLDTAKRSQVMWLVSELVERIRSNPDGQATGYTTAPTSCTTVPAVRCADNSSGAAATNCTPNQMATFDVWEVFCGQTENNVTANATDKLNLTSVNISCGTGACTPRSTYTVNISWESQSVDSSRLLTSSGISSQKTQTITMAIRP